MAATSDATTVQRNRYTLAELAGVFGDLGTLIPFVAAYVSVVKMDRFVVLTTAAFAVWNVGIAVVFGALACHAAKRGWLRV